MLLKLPENEKVSWTRHSKKKLRQYRLSEKRVLRVLRHPDRKETGVAPKTIAMMQITGTKKHPTEIWMMYQIKNQKFRIISAWRYPGRTPKGKPPPIPDDVFQDLLLETGVLK